MASNPFKVEVAGIGDFLFRPKQFRDQIKIEAMASETLGRTVDSLRPDERGLAAVAIAHAHLATLTLDAPQGWDLEAMDPVDVETTDLVMKVYGRLAEELARFRRECSQKRATPGAPPI